MGQTKKAIYKVHNGTDFDTIHFETEASQVKTAGGSNVETVLAGKVNKSDFLFTVDSGGNGWKKNVITGEIEQWGQYNFTASGGTFDTGAVTFPIAFPTGAYNIAFSLYPTDITTWVSSGFINGYVYNPISFRAVISGLTAGKSYKLYYRVIGN